MHEVFLLTFLVMAIQELSGGGVNFILAGQVLCCGVTAANNRTCEVCGDTCLQETQGLEG